MSEEPADNPSSVPLARRAVLPYQGALPTSAVTVGTFYHVYEAHIFANQLASQGIDYFLMNQNVNVLGAYAGFSQIELQVRKEDLAAARNALAQFQASPLEVEPAERTDPDQPIPDPAGEGLLVTAGRFDNPRSLFDAAAILGAARVEGFLPLLVPRSNLADGATIPFVLRVRAGDLAAAREILSNAAAEEADEDEPRCPKCGSYRVAAVSSFWADLMQFIRGASKSKQQMMECLRCRQRWDQQT
jgi:hypothetical protein